MSEKTKCEKHEKGPVYLAHQQVMCQARALLQRMMFVCFAHNLCLIN